MATTGGGAMEHVRVRSLDAGVYRAALPSPSPRKLAAAPAGHHLSPREPSGFRKSLNPIYTDDVAASDVQDHPTAGSVPSSGADLGGSTCTPAAEAALAVRRRHTGDDRDERWEAIRAAGARESPLSLGHFRLLRRLGYGDIGSVYLVELRGGGGVFAMKVMDKGSLANRKKVARAETEREILGLLDHPFLPTLYSHFETDKFCCLLMEYCSGGNLHSLRQRQPNKRFNENAARFYASEVLLALEYLHMLGVVYRDLKPENVLVREEGHIMLSDFDLSLRCSVNPTLVRSPSCRAAAGGRLVHGCMLPRILSAKKGKKTAAAMARHHDELTTAGDCKRWPAAAALEFTAEPTGARSMSFVGTHEYLAPEIIRGEGHGSAVDWWTFGVFLYELLHGATPFKGSGNRATLFNVVGQPLRFPDAAGAALGGAGAAASAAARDLIGGLLVKDPQKRLGYRRGAAEVKQHPFFEGVNWALVRSAAPPYIPGYDDRDRDAADCCSRLAVAGSGGAAQGGTPRSAAGGKASSPHADSSYVEFEYF